MKVAIIEDEKKLADSLGGGLRKEGYDVDVFYNAEDAESVIRSRQNSYSLLLLDLILPRKSGFTLCEDLRSDGVSTPILVLTARDTTEDKIAALDTGADDFLSKPFAFEELLARMRALMRRPEIKGLTAELRAGDLVLDLKTRRVFRSKKEIFLTFKEFELLRYLMQRNGQVVTRDDIMGHLWRLDGLSLGNVLDVHIRNLRKKIDDDHNTKIIRTVRGVGYSVQG